MTIPKIVLYVDSFNGRVGISDVYVDFFSQFGEVMLVSAQNDLKFYLEHGDVLAMPGGADVDPERYGEFPTYLMSRSNPHYEVLDKHLLIPWIATGKPIIGICRGMQSLNVALGGSLYQHINGHIGDGNHRDKTEDAIFTDIEGEDFDYKIHFVNTFHHQAVKELGDGLECIGWGTVYRNCPSLKDRKKKPTARKIWERVKGFRELQQSKHPYFSIPEIIKHSDKPYIGFQYHPEEFNCPLAIKLIEETLSSYYPELKENPSNEIEKTITVAS